MSTDIKLNSESEWDAGAYSIVEDATPIQPSNPSGGIGQISVDLPLRPHPRRLRGQTLSFQDDEWGSTSGIVREVDGDSDGITIAADSKLSRLSVERKAAPFTGTLGDLLRYYFGLCGITTDIVIDAALNTRSVLAPGFYGSIWDALKELAIAEQFEVALTGTQIVCRGLRQRTLGDPKDSSVTWSTDAASMAEKVELFYTTGSWKTAGLAYPAGGWADDVSVYTVDAGEELVVELKLDIDGDEEGPGASVVSVQQPVCVDTVSRSYAANSVYAVAGSDGLPLKAKQWTDGGGKLSVKVVDANTLEVTIKASRSTQYAPYSIAMSAGPSDMYSSLRIVGTGYFYTRRRLETQTGADPDLASAEMGATVDNRFTTNYTKAERMLLATAQEYGAPRLKVDVQAGGVEWDEPTKGVVGGQLLGNVAGARLMHGGVNYRVDSVTTTADGVSYSGSGDHIIADVNAIWAGRTMAEWNAHFAGLRMRDFNVEPLSSPS